MRPDRRTDRRTDMVIPVYPPNFVAGGITRVVRISCLYLLQFKTSQRLMFFCHIQRTDTQTGQKLGAPEFHFKGIKKFIFGLTKLIRDFMLL